MALRALAVAVDSKEDRAIGTTLRNGEVLAMRIDRVGGAEYVVPAQPALRHVAFRPAVCDLHMWEGHRLPLGVREQKGGLVIGGDSERQRRRHDYEHGSRCEVHGLPLGARY